MATRLQLRNDVLNIADAVNSPRWDVTPGTGEVDRRLGVVHMRLWKRVLNANPFINVAAFALNNNPGAISSTLFSGTVAADANGAIPISSLSTGVGDFQQNLYKILMVSFNNMPYQQQWTKDYLLSNLNGFTFQSWYQEGGFIFIPDSPGQTATGIWVNWLPTAFDQLVVDSSTVSLPSATFGDAFAHFGAAAILRKGGAETQAAAEIEAYGQQLLDEELQDLARVGSDPIFERYDDSPFDWASQ